MSLRTYNVELTVFGEITTEETISFNTDKELNHGNIFNSDVIIKSHPQGLRISSTVYTENRDRAFKVALLFIGRMLDVLAIKTETPLFIYNNEIKPVLDRNTTKAIISSQEFQECFKFSRYLNLNHTAFLTGLNWYRKGLYTEDPYDKFLAYWNSISIVSSKYHTPNDRTQNGIINQIWNCFETLWGTDTAHWPFIHGDNRWINNNNQTRDTIAHGLVPVEVGNVENVIAKLENTQKVAHKFLTAWSQLKFETALA